MTLRLRKGNSFVHTMKYQCRSHLAFLQIIHFSLVADKQFPAVKWPGDSFLFDRTFMFICRKLTSGKPTAVFPVNIHLLYLILYQLAKSISWKKNWRGQVQIPKRQITKGAPFMTGSSEQRVESKQNGPTRGHLQEHGNGAARSRVSGTADLKQALHLSSKVWK